MAGSGLQQARNSAEKIAQRVVKEPFWGSLPSSVDSLMTLPGIGRATASSVATFAFQQPVAFIETNIRRVYLHFFFRERENIRDNEILPLVEKNLDRKNPRQWYFALMDYGAMLKKLEQNPNRRSAHYQKQPPFQGSNRQVRVLILKALIAAPNSSELKIARILSVKTERIKENLRQLQKEGFITKKAKGFVNKNMTGVTGKGVVDKFLYSFFPILPLNARLHLLIFTFALALSPNKKFL